MDPSIELLIGSDTRGHFIEEDPRLDRRFDGLDRPHRLGFAALKNPTDLWASVAFTIMFVLLLLSLVGVGFRRGNKQLFWAGFAVFGWGNLILFLNTGVMRPPVSLISRLVTYLQSVFSPPAHFINITYRPVTTVISSGPSITGSLTGVFLQTDSAFSQIGHSFAVLLLALLGSMLVQVFAKREVSQI